MPSVLDILVKGGIDVELYDGDICLISGRVRNVIPIDRLEIKDAQRKLEAKHEEQIKNLYEIWQISTEQILAKQRELIDHVHRLGEEIIRLEGIPKDAEPTKPTYSSRKKE
jgi:hypothetical protein